MRSEARFPANQTIPLSSEDGLTVVGLQIDGRSVRLSCVLSARETGNLGRVLEIRDVQPTPGFSAAADQPLNLSLRYRMKRVGH
jgi:hypothetical protein